MAGRSCSCSTRRVPIDGPSGLRRGSSPWRSSARRSRSCSATRSRPPLPGSSACCWRSSRRSSSCAGSCYSPTITVRLVLGALSIYLLLGLAYAYLFPLVATLSDDPFFVQTTTPNASDYIYFSYTTLATIGYGDYTAATSLGRMVSVSEGLVGQLYLVSAVALLVGNVGRQLRRNEPH